MDCAAEGVPGERTRPVQRSQRQRRLPVPRHGVAPLLVPRRGALRAVGRQGLFRHLRAKAGLAGRKPSETAPGGPPGLHPRGVPADFQCPRHQPEFPQDCRPLRTVRDVRRRRVPAATMRARRFLQGRTPVAAVRSGHPDLARFVPHQPGRGEQQRDSQPELGRQPPGFEELPEIRGHPFPRLGEGGEEPPVVRREPDRDPGRLRTLGPAAPQIHF